MLNDDQLGDLRVRCMDLARDTPGRAVQLRGGPLHGFHARLTGKTFQWGLSTLTDRGAMIAEYELDGEALTWRGWYRAGDAVVRRD